MFFKDKRKKYAHKYHVKINDFNFTQVLKQKL